MPFIWGKKSLTKISTENLCVFSNVIENSVLLHCFLYNSSDLKPALLFEKLLTCIIVCKKSCHEFLCALHFFKIVFISFSEFLAM